MLDFELNQVTMTDASIDEFVDAAARLEMVGVELRNDLGRSLFDGLTAKQIQRMLGDRGLRLLGVLQVYPFNRWSSDISGEVQALIDAAQRAGAEAISLISCNDRTGLDADTRRDDLMRALEACLPLLKAANMVANVEPLGFARFSLRCKAELVTAIDALGASDSYRLVHDTFHHSLADGGSIFADRTWIVHISGVSNQKVPLGQMEGAHRVLIYGEDRLGNLRQIKALQASGYRGTFTLESFAPEIHRLGSLENAIGKSKNFVSSHVHVMAA
ncbi:MAG: TIM barrel protein [Yoonia sp.]|uniref:TIM barrel protein n=1 Tax=Yoonia sp. TaxID=2212373 RepID=UPI003EF525D4